MQGVADRGQFDLALGHPRSVDPTDLPLFIKPFSRAGFEDRACRQRIDIEHNKSPLAKTSRPEIVPVPYAVSLVQQDYSWERRITLGHEGAAQHCRWLRCLQ